jgi:hypothetical protein
MKRVLILFYLLFLTGCGHSIVRTDRGTGLHLRVPNPFNQGESFVDFKIGNIDTSMAVIRGNTTFDSTSAKGGSLTGIGGISERITVAAKAQLNEGYVAEVLTSPNVDSSTKIEIAKYLALSNAPKVSDSKSISIGAAAGSGDKSNEITPEKTGIDNIVDKTADTIIKITPDVAKATENTVSNISKDVADTTQHISNDVADTTQHVAEVAGDVTEEFGNAILHHIILSFLIAITLTIVIVFFIEWIIKKHELHKQND